MERATELHWLKFFYQHADIGLTEEQRMEIERQFVKEENLLLPKAYEIDGEEISMAMYVEGGTDISNMHNWPIPMHDEREVPKHSILSIGNKEQIDEYLLGIINRKEIIFNADNQ